ncbi:MAG: hypothetical protein JO301_02650 [Chitinophagaceae bacterium]|nr:hypothetical protein [Chitinophagaceae bacterium]
MKTKNYLILWFLVMITLVFLSFRPQRTGAVAGSINPPDGASQVWLLSERDTIRGMLKNGSFDIAGVKPGFCVLVVDAIPPYKNTTRTGIEVFEGSTTNVGEIYLDQRQK